ncbi:hypothetical protein SALBM311S_04777 [Streptomyces alboniger]
MPRPLRVTQSAPPGIYAADALLKSDVAAEPGVSISTSSGCRPRSG